MKCGAIRRNLKLIVEIGSCYTLKSSGRKLKEAEGSYYMSLSLQNNEITIKP